MKADDVKYIVTHCSDTKWSHDVDVNDIRQWHTDKGWSDVGYHFVIKLDGTIQVGRNLETEGAHAYGFNDCSIGICLVGGKDEDGSPSANYNIMQLESWLVLNRTLLKVFPNAHVCGHNDLTDSKTCPNFNVKEHWRAIGN